MPDRLEAIDVTCPANTLHTAPIEVALNFPGGIVRHIEVVIPTGHAGVTGIAIAFGHQPIVPFTAGTFLEGDDDIVPFPYNDRNPGVAWSAFVYNEDLQPHAWQVRFQLDEIGATTPQPSAPTVTADDIVAAGNDALSVGVSDATGTIG